MPPNTDSRSPVRRAARCLLPLICIFALSYSIYGDDINVLHPDIWNRNDATAPWRLVNDREDGETRQGGFRVGVNVDLVVVYASVFDKQDRFISGLKKENFNLYEDGDRQDITYFSQVDVPITIGIALDLSGSMEDKKEQVNRAARAFIQAGNPDDQVFLIGFNDIIEELCGFTNDVDEITDALENSITAGGTALYDAIYLGVEKAHQGSKFKKAIIVISDGEDKDSFYSLSDLIDFVQESDVQIFSIGFLDKIPSKSLFGKWFKTDAEKAREALERISAESGGKAYFPDEVTDIHGIVAEIASELRNQYSIGYVSSNTARDGSWRRIVVRLDKGVAGNLRVRHRTGYYAPENKNEPPPSR